MQTLFENGFRTPRPIDQNRHGIVMSLIDGPSLHQLRRVEDQDLLKSLFDQCVGMIFNLAKHGLIHSDFNEYNLLVDDTHLVTMIDFPQMVSTSHFNANFYFQRDLQGILAYFSKTFGYD